ncbi:MAG TPA: hypothetical protein VFY48_10805 [Solirubrobacterales bacterium]|nr:hypothetical protein [Solirubrobacterales bacterium]
MRAARNVGIVMLLALAVAFVPGGSNVADTIYIALVLGLLAGMSWFVYVLSRQNQLTLATLSDSRRAVLYGAVGMLVLLVAGSPKLFASGGGTLLWILLLGASFAAIWWVWSEANSY